MQAYVFDMAEVGYLIRDAKDMPAVTNKDEFLKQRLGLIRRFLLGLRSAYTPVCSYTHTRVVSSIRQSLSPFITGTVARAAMPRMFSQSSN